MSRRRRGTPADLLVVGLGNPGKEYARHAATTSAAEVVELLATRHGGRAEEGKERALRRRGRASAAGVVALGRSR